MLSHDENFSKAPNQMNLGQDVSPILEIIMVSQILIYRMSPRLLMTSPFKQDQSIQVQEMSIHCVNRFPFNNDIIPPNLWNKDDFRYFAT